MDRTAEEVKTGVEESGQVREGLEAITNSIEEFKNLAVKNEGFVRDMVAASDIVTKAIGEVAATSQDTSAGAEELAAMTEEVAASTQEVTASVQEVANGALNVKNVSQEMSAEAQEMQELVQQFQLPETGDAILLKGEGDSAAA